MYRSGQQTSGVTDGGQDYQQHELTQFNGQAATTSLEILSQSDFLSNVSMIRDDLSILSNDIANIGVLHQRALADTTASTTAGLEDVVTRTRVLNQRIRDHVKQLELDTKRTPSQPPNGLRRLKEQQCRAVKRAFEEELRSYQHEEQTYRTRYREQIARQYRIANPGASASEVNEAANADWGDEGVFQTALRSNRSGNAANVLGAVRARHTDVQRIETTLVEIANLFQDMAQLVEVQEPLAAEIDDNAQKTAQDVEKAVTEIKKAGDHARRIRKLKWWTLGIFLTIVILLAIALGVYFYEMHLMNQRLASAAKKTAGP